MNDPRTLAGRPIRLRAAGCEYEVWPLTLADFGDLQSWVDAQFADPFDIASDAIARGDYTPAQEQYLLRMAMERACAPKPQIGAAPEADAMVRSMAGIKEMLYLAIRKGDAFFTREHAASLYAALSPGQIAAVFQETGAELLVSDPPRAAAPDASTGGASIAV